MKGTQTADQYYSRRGCERMAISVILFLIIMPILVMAAVRCEEQSSCWECEVNSKFKSSESGEWIEVTKHYPPYCGENVDSLKQWQDNNTYSDETVDQVARCSKAINTF